MTLILLAISLTMMLSILAYQLALYALPVMVGLSAAQYAWGAGAGFLVSGCMAIAAAILSITLVIAVLCLAKQPALRIVAVAIFAIPAAIAGFALVHGVAKNATDSAAMLNLLSCVGGLFIAIAAMINLNTLGLSVLSR